MVCNDLITDPIGTRLSVKAFKLIHCVVCEDNATVEIQYGRLAHDIEEDYQEASIDFARTKT